MTAQLFQAPTSNFWSSSLNGSINDTVDTFTLNSTTGLQSPGYLIIDREDGQGTATPSAREVIKYTGISGSDLTGVTRGADGSTARSHSDGALVEAIMTVGTWNDMRSTITAEHTTAGAHLPISSATITTLTNTTLTSTTINATNLNGGVKGQFYWSRAGALATVLEATAGDTHFPMQRASKNLTLTSFFAGLGSAPSIKPAEFDISYLDSVSYASTPTAAFTSIFSVRPFVDIGEHTSIGSATAGTLSLTSLASGTLLKYEVRMHGESGDMFAQLNATERV